ncbi:MAG: c-type cytochrome [Rhodospirillales bacterium]|nr:MAG: c-type cytochrome [Rhodospirillales bacterium]
MRYLVTRVLTSAVLVAGATGIALAQGESSLQGDIAAGKATAASTCAACHGVDGLSTTSGIPHLAGQHAEYVWSGLSLYKKGERRNRRMHDVVDTLGESDMANVAVYYASLKPFSQAPRQAAGPLPTDEDPFAAVREATAECAGCHGEDGNSDVPGIPSLAGQHVTYLIDSMRAYQEGLRKNEEMLIFVEELKGSDIEDMAYFYASQAPMRTETAAEGDQYRGRQVTAPCVGCHADDGNNKDPKTPRLAGLDPEYLVAAANAYKDGSRAHDVMREAVATMRDTDIQDMAAYYASHEPKALPVRKPMTISEWAARCNRCHGPDGRSTDPRFPILAGQDEAYLIKALKLYHGGERPSSAMQAMSFLMAESDILKLAAYYARQPAR